MTLLRFVVGPLARIGHRGIDLVAIHPTTVVNHLEPSNGTVSLEETDEDVGCASIEAIVDKVRDGSLEGVVATHRLRDRRIGCHLLKAGDVPLRAHQRSSNLFG